METYKVARQHYGDKQYFEGETRDMLAADAKALIGAGLLIDDNDADADAKKAAAAAKKAEKAAEAAANKMAAEPTNKAE